MLKTQFSGWGGWGAERLNINFSLSIQYRLFLFPYQYQFQYQSIQRGLININILSIIQNQKLKFPFQFGIHHRLESCGELYALATLQASHGRGGLPA